MAKLVRYSGESTTPAQTVEEIRALLASADAAALASYERWLVCDTRKGVREALKAARARIEREAAETARVSRLFAFDARICAEQGGGVIVGLDEVGRGPLAGPLAVGAVVFSPDCTPIRQLNDSKQVSPDVRKTLADVIKSSAQAWAVEFIEPSFIDAHGMTHSLKTAFSAALSAIEHQGIVPDVVLLDGNPLHFDRREVNVVKGDTLSASIAAASIVAKVARDAYMEEQALNYPVYKWQDNKGYASAEHIATIKEYGLSPLHRESFCHAFTQPTLF